MKFQDFFKVHYRGFVVSIPGVIAQTSGSTCLQLSLGGNHFKKGKDGSLSVETDYIDGTIWVDNENVKDYAFRKGTRVVVKGELREEKWVNATGEKRRKHVIKIKTIEPVPSDNEI